MSKYQEALIEQEKQAIRNRRNVRLADWQVKAIYFIAMLNNQALHDGRQEFFLKVEPGNPPTITEHKKGV